MLGIFLNSVRIALQLHENKDLQNQDENGNDDVKYYLLASQAVNMFLGS